jgi:RNA polymerase sigma-70 factor (ECF subfamily)
MQYTAKNTVHSAGILNYNTFRYVSFMPDVRGFMAQPGEVERTLISEAKDGSAQALATLLQMNYAAVYRTLVKLTMDPRTAQDATQDAMERAIRNIRSFDPDKAKFSTWLVAIARNRWLDELRKNRRTKPMAEGAADGAEGSHDPFAEVIRNDELLSALAGMDPKARAPVSMRYLLDMSYEEIAKDMRIPLGTVKSRIFNGLRQLRRELKDGA